MRYRRLFVLLITLLMAIDVSAQGLGDVSRLSLPGYYPSARSAGMGNAYTAVSDDASAVYFNPAGLGLIKKMEFSGGFDYNHINNNATFLNIPSAYTNSESGLNQASFIFPFPTVRGSFVIGMSYYKSKSLIGALKFDGFNSGNTSMIQDLTDTNVPFDLYLTDEDYVTKINGKLQQSGSILESGSINNFGFSAAIEVYKDLFLGGTFNIISGSYLNSNEYNEDDTQHFYDNDTLAPGYAFSRDFVSFRLNRTIDWNIAAWEFKAGLLYKMKDIARIGLTIQTPKYFTIKEKFDVEGSSLFGDGTLKELDPYYYSDNVEYDVTTPPVMTLGGAVTYKGLLVSAEGSLIDYTQSEFSNANGIKPGDIAAMNKEIKENFRAVVNYNFGIEYTVRELGLRLRGGYAVVKSPYAGDPTDYDRKYITGGIGFIVDDAVSVDFAYINGAWKGFIDNYGVNLSRVFTDINNSVASLSFNYRF